MTNFSQQLQTVKDEASPLRFSSLPEHLSSNRGLFRSLAFVGCGITLGWTSPYLPRILNGEIEGLSMTSGEGSWCAVMPLLGSPFGAFFAATFVDRLGRKYTTLMMAPVMLCMFLLLGSTKSTVLVCLSRFVIGCIEAGLYTTLTMYYREIATPSIRGIFLATIAVATITGMLFINIVGIYYSILATSLMSCVIPIVHFGIFAFMPESPYYLIKKSKINEARTSLQLLRSKSNVDQELEEIQSAVRRQENGTKGIITDLFTVGSNRKAIIIFVILHLNKTFSGKNPLLFYTTTIFQTAQGDLSPHTAVIIYISIEMVATAAALFFIDRLGRIPIIVFSTAGCAMALCCTGLYFFLKDTNYDYIDSFGWVPITALVLYNICFSLGLELAPTVYLSELFPTDVQGAALGFAGAFSAINGAVAVKIFQILGDLEGMHVPFWIFSGCCMFGLGFILKYVPETKNKTLEEIELELIRERREP